MFKKQIEKQIDSGGVRSTCNWNAPAMNTRRAFCVIMSADLDRLEAEARDAKRGLGQDAEPILQSL